MNIFIAYTKLLDATEVSLRNYDYEPIEMKNEFSYSRYFKDRWEVRQSFINIEHDCVIWPGAIESLKDCPREWCAFDYRSDTSWKLEQAVGILHSIQMGCMKITQEMIDKTKNIWNEPVVWDQCDIHLFNETVKAGIKIHQHHPGIVNANPVLKKHVDLHEGV